MYIRISDENNTWLDQQAAAAGITKAAAVDTIVSVARTEGWQLQAAPHAVVSGRTSPAAGPGATPEAGQ
jgi:hypothetical protein